MDEELGYVKRLLGMFLLVLLCACWNAALGEAGYGEMIVVDCEEWVSLRASASTKAERLAKVPLGAKVTGCRYVDAYFTYCEYDGLGGYVLSEYLEAVQAEGADGAYALPYEIDGYTVELARTAVGNGEGLVVYCTDGAGNVVWQNETFTTYCTELTLTEAFVGGTELRPLVIVYNAETMTYALDFYTGAVVWTVPEAAASLGGSISYAVDAAGTAYIGGYYGPDPVAIDVNGNVLWKAQADREAYWLSDVAVTGEGIVATYDCLVEHEKSGRICYDRLDGSVLWTD